MSIVLALEESQVSFIPYLPKDKQEKRRLFIPYLPKDKQEKRRLNFFWFGGEA
jgi:hypothetical protein